MTDDKIKQLEVKNTQLEERLNSLSDIAMASAKSHSKTDSEIDLRGLWKATWEGKWLILIVTVIFAICSVWYALSIPNQYKATALLTPASTSSTSALSKLAGQFGGLASFAGIDIDAGGAEDKSVIAMELIKTWGFIETFIKENNIEVEVFAVEGWNREGNKLLIDSDIYDETNNRWVRNDFDSNKGQQPKPSSWELYEGLRDRITINRDKTTGLISLSVEYYSPLIAKKWVDMLVVSINSYIQKEDREEATKSIDYLNKKIVETNIADMQSVFYQLIEEQTKTLMLAEVSDEYVFKTISPSKVAEESSKPNRVLIVLFFTMAGGFLSLMITLYRFLSKL